MSRLLLAIGSPLPVPTEPCPDAEDRVRRRAARLVREVAERIPGWGSPPFDPRVLARALGVPIHFTHDLDGIDGLIVQRRGGFHILANSKVTHPGRLNFTLAHELGHLFFAGAERKAHLRARERRSYDSSAEGRALERLCDVAASELLMPSPWFEDRAKSAGFNAATVALLAERFQVSLEASALRLLRTRSDESRAVGLFEYAVRPSARGRVDPPDCEPASYRVRRVFRTRSFPFLFPEGKSVPSESVIYRASLGLHTLEADECFSLGRTRQRLGVSAAPLHRGETVDEPPLVCAVFRAW